MLWRNMLEAISSLVFVAILPLVELTGQTTTQAALAGPLTTDESMLGRGSLMFGDKCEATIQCGFRGSVCDPTLKTCQCIPDLPITNHLDKCGKAAQVNDSCFFTEQCELTVHLTECRDGRCVCRFDKTPVFHKDGSVECLNDPKPTEPPHRVDPAMYGILAGMALMFIIICVVLRLFSKARWRENRTIFNTPNPRLMNVSLLPHKPDQRRGSKGSVRGPSRAASVSSLRPRSPSGSQGSKTAGSRRNSRASNHSPGSREKSPTKMADGHLESVTVESEPPPPPYHA